MNDLGNLLNVPLEIYTCVYLEFRVASGGETDRRTKKPPNDLRRDFADDQKYQAGPTDNAKDNATSNQTSIRTQNCAGDAVQKNYRQPKYA